ncbi:MAG: Nicotinamidase-related amidase, partial [Myxococcaceae bacterium]|nr:Nicotinamidase-related amidase [Myxococcaceae bacterium]
AVIVGGFTTDSCIHFTASDAYLRGLGLTILRDGCAAQTSTQHTTALREMGRVLHAETTHCKDISFAAQKRRAARGSIKI